MPKFLFVCLLLGLALAIAACNDSGSGKSADAGTTPGAEATAASTETPTATDGPADDGTPVDDESPTPGAESPTPGGSPVPLGTPSLTPLPTQPQTRSEDCTYDPETSTALCEGGNSYTLGESAGGGYTDCTLVLFSDTPLMLTCVGGENVQPLYYEIPRE